MTHMWGLRTTDTVLSIMDSFKHTALTEVLNLPKFTLGVSVYFQEETAKSIFPNFSQKPVLFRHTKVTTIAQKFVTGQEIFHKNMSCNELKPIGTPRGKIDFSCLPTIYDQ